jgi:LPS-assembly lipoprotein
MTMPSFSRFRLRRRIVAAASVIFLVAGLAGCGFEPLYGERKDVSVVGELAAVRIAPIPDRAGQILRNFLLDQINPRGTAQAAAYTLTIQLS